MNYNIYIDESCYLANDKIPVMCIGYTKIPAASYQNIKEQLKRLKLQHKSPTEIKWSKLSLSRIALYKAIIDFFISSDIEFRCVLIKNKKNLDNKKYNDSNHETFYNKVVYYLLNNDYTNSVNDSFKVVLDIKNTRGKERLAELDSYLKLKYKKQGKDTPFKYFQHIRSHENELLQLTDLLIGAITYKSRNDIDKTQASPVKLELIEYIEKQIGYTLDKGTVPWEQKFNIFDFQIKCDQ